MTNESEKANATPAVSATGGQDNGQCEAPAGAIDIEHATVSDDPREWSRARKVRVLLCALHGARDDMLTGICMGS